MSDARVVASPARAWRQTALISVTAVAVFMILRRLPLAGDSLHYSDFGAGERGFLEFCEPGSPQFAPVDRVRSPVLLALHADAPLRMGEPARVTAELTTAGGKPVAAGDLVEVHERILHVLLIDATLADYQHVHPEPGANAGSYVFTFIPRRAGRYRVFADFMPRATGRALYAGAALAVAGESDPPLAANDHRPESLTATVDGLAFRLAADVQPLRVNQTARLVLTIARTQGGAPLLEDVMGAPAHLVAFDARCSGFAHLHPAPPTPEFAAATDAGRNLVFTIHLPDPGSYRLWAQVKVEGREIFAPFDLTVKP